MDKYALIFEGPQSGDADSLRKLKAAFLAELNFTVEQTINALSNCPLSVRESEDQTSLEDLLATLIAAGARARIDEPASPKPNHSEHLVDSLANKPSSETLVFELETSSLETSTRETFAKPLAFAPPSQNVPTLSSAQSTLLSLEDDFETSDTPNPAPLNPTPSEPPPYELTRAEATPIKSSSKAPEAASLQSPSPTSPGQTSLEAFTLELSDVDPEPQVASAPLPTEHELEIHFETEDGTSAPAPGLKTVNSPQVEPSEVKAAAQIAAQPAAPPAQVLPSPNPVAPAPAAPAALTVSGNGNSVPLIPNFKSETPSGEPAAATAKSIDRVSDSAPIEPVLSGSVSRSKRYKLHSRLQDLAIGIVLPLVTLIVGNIVFFLIWGDKNVAPTPALTVDKALQDEDQSSNEKKSKDAILTPSSYEGVKMAGDFEVDWKVVTLGDDMVSVGIKIIPPAPKELTAKEIVAGVKPALKVTSIELDDLPLTKVGKLAASIRGPGRIAMIDDSRVLRAVANAEFSVELNPETKVLSGQISLQTEAAKESALRWVAERGENSRPNIKLNLSF